MRLPAVLGALLLTASVAVHAAAAANAPAPAAQAPTAMLAHKALYNLTMDTAKGNDVVAARGTMGAAPGGLQLTHHVRVVGVLRDDRAARHTPRIRAGVIERPLPEHFPQDNCPAQQLALP